MRGSLADRADSTFQLPPEEQCAANRHQQRHQRARKDRTAYELFELVLVLHVAAYDEDAAVVEARDAQSASGRASGAHDLMFKDAVGQIDDLTREREITRDDVAVGTDESVDLSV